MIDDLRRRIEGEEFDYQTLLDSLKQYERPRDKITSLLRKGAVTVHHFTKSCEKCGLKPVLGIA